MRRSTLFLLVLTIFCGRTLTAQPLKGKLTKEGTITKYVFPVSGPTEPSTLPKEEHTSWREFESGPSNAVAVLLADTNSNWLGIARGLRSIGIPFFLTTNSTEAIKHRVIICYPGVARDADPQQFERAIESGRTIIAPNLANPRFGKVFGFSKIISSSTRTSIHFGPELAAASSFDAPEELTVPFANPKDSYLAHNSLSYVITDARAQANYEDQSIAVIARQKGSGTAYAIGIDIGYLMQTGYNAKQTNVARSYVNHYEPAVDVWLRTIKCIYQQHEPNAVTLWPVPDGHSLTVLFTHDIDYYRSVKNAVAYAAMENKYGVKATYFVQTKYITDYEDRAFLNDSATTFLQALDSMGMEIGSHSISHSRQFSKFDIGSGTEVYPTYTPWVKNMDTTLSGTIFGELRGSKYILEQVVAKKVESFRPGYLANPRALPEALCATGFCYSSSITANNAMSHLPFQLTYSQASNALVPQYAFPITIEDDVPPTMDKRLDSALQLANQLSKYGGLYCILIHPNRVDFKYNFEESFIQAVKDKAWFGTTRDFGQFWSARNSTEVAVSEEGARKVVTVHAPKEILGLTLEVPATWQLAAQPTGLSVRSVSGRVVIDRLQGEAELEFVANPSQH
jgi:peptidoglycan/xylan/chitin deacetylase (PgdA/CDA1 family)